MKMTRTKHYHTIIDSAMPQGMNNVLQVLPEWKRLPKSAHVDDVKKAESLSEFSSSTGLHVFPSILLRLYSPPCLVLRGPQICLCDWRSSVTMNQYRRVEWTSGYSNAARLSMKSSSRRVNITYKIKMCTAMAIIVQFVITTLIICWKPVKLANANGSTSIVLVTSSIKSLVGESFDR